MKKLFLNLFRMIVLLLFFPSCMAPPQKSLHGSNSKVKVELLFEIDGCKVYRFYDGSGSPRYFTKCQNSSSVGWVESCGKDCEYYTENLTQYTNDSFHLPNK